MKQAAKAIAIPAMLGLQGQLVEGEDRSGSHREVALALSAAPLVTGLNKVVLGDRAAAGAPHLVPLNPR